MAPYFGTSMTIWTTINRVDDDRPYRGVSGIVVERTPRASLLGTLLFFAAVFVVFLPYITQPVMTSP